MASKRLHLPQPPGVRAEEQLVWHFGHTADPVYMGSCTVLPPGLRPFCALFCEAVVLTGLIRDR
jgi:putative lipase involved disintegration of autophagic bodies